MGGRNGDRVPGTFESSSSNLRRHFSRELVVDTLRLTLDVVDELEPPDDLRLATFNAAFGMFGKFYDARAAAAANILHGGIG